VLLVQIKAYILKDPPNEQTSACKSRICGGKRDLNDGRVLHRSLPVCADLSCCGDFDTAASSSFKCFQAAFVSGKVQIRSAGTDLQIIVS
jgi:hypothetical protein